MADKKISQLPQGNITSETIFPVVDGGITSQVSFEEIQDAIGGGSGGGNSYVRGWETDNENGNSVTIGKGLGKITLTNGINTFIGIDGANFDTNDIGSVGFSYRFTVVLNDGTRRYIEVNDISDSTHGDFDTIYLDNQGNIEDGGGNWDHASGDYDYFPYFISDASGEYSYAEGRGTIASGSHSHAEGWDTTASGSYGAHAEGRGTQAIGYAAHAEGNNTISDSYASHAQNTNTQARGFASHAGGQNSIASGNTSFVHGNNSFANGDNSVVLGANITGNQNDTTYVDNLNIKQLLSLNVITAPTSPQDGQIWLESNSLTGLKIRISGVTRTITIS